MTFDFGNNQLIMLSASANKLSRLKERAEEYASLIMEELDPENFGYIEVRNGHNCSLLVFFFFYLILLSVVPTSGKFFSNLILSIIGIYIPILVFSKQHFCIHHCHQTY